MISHNEPERFAFIIILTTASFLTLPFRILVHEAGHAFAARAMGQIVVEARVGRGPVTWKWHVADIPFTFHRYLHVGGLMHAIPIKTPINRAGRAFIIAAGPMANLACAAIFFWASYVTGIFGGLAAALGGVGLAQATMGFFNLIPRKSGDDDGLVSDGQALLNLLRPATVSDAHIDQILMVAYLVKARRDAEVVTIAGEGIWTSPFRYSLASNLLHSLSRTQGDQAALTFYKTHRIALDGCGDAEQDKENGIPWIQANVAWSAIKSNDPAWRNLADNYSNKALAAHPDAAEMQGTRGAWLVVNGDVEIGLKLLAKAIRSVDNPIDKADFCRFLALGLRKRADSTEAAMFEMLEAHLKAA